MRDACFASYTSSVNFVDSFPSKGKPFWVDKIAFPLRGRWVAERSSDEVEMNKTNNKNLTGNAKALRKNMTKEEKHLWYDFLKTLPVTVNRQKVIGSYIVDFYIASAKLVIELDGSQHFEQAGEKRDAERDTYLSRLGIQVFRYSNLELNQNFEGVCEEILNNLEKSKS